ncbi:MAG: rRNA adenine N-6-methyltransferase family protein [Acidimicrobiia bacterium]
MSGQRTRWGWHQLGDRWARRIVAAAIITPGSLVLDVGAGHGALTSWLVDAGARVIAVELHPARARQLRQRFSSTTVKVIQVNAVDLRLPRRPFRVVANPPFAISTALIKRLLSAGSQLQQADLVVPRHVAHR